MTRTAMPRTGLSRAALAALALGALCGLPAAAQTVVSGDWISLGDVAPVTGEAAKVLLTAAPPPGQTLALDPAFVTSVAKQSGVIIVLPAGEPLLVRRAGATLQAPSATVARSAPIAQQAPEAIPIAASEPQPDGWVLVLLRDVARGARLSPEDLGWKDPADLRGRRGGVTDLAAVVGLETKRMLKAGAPVQAADVQAIKIIRKGDPVKLVYAAPGLRLTVDGLAQADAAAGEGVRVLNNFSKRVIEAQAVSEGEARVMRR